MSNMVVRTNVFALNAHRNMKNVGLEQGRASNRLSSGYRINSAADDAAGLAISETMRAQIRGLDQASRNAQDGQSMILTTEGGLEEIGNMLSRVRELLVQASNDTNTQDQRTMIEQEIRQLAQEVSSMQQRVEFNTNRVLAMGPAMVAGVTNDMSLLQEDMNALTDAFDLVQEMVRDVAVAREMLTAMPPLADQSTLNNQQTEAVNRALAALSFASVASFVTETLHGTDLMNDDEDEGFVFNLDAMTPAGTMTDVISLLDSRNLELQAIVTELNDYIGQLHVASRNTFSEIRSFVAFEAISDRRPASRLVDGWEWVGNMRPAGQTAVSLESAFGFAVGGSGTVVSGVLLQQIGSPSAFASGDYEDIAITDDISIRVRVSGTGADARWVISGMGLASAFASAAGASGTLAFTTLSVDGREIRWMFSTTGVGLAGRIDDPQNPSFRNTALSAHAPTLATGGTFTRGQTQTIYSGGIELGTWTYRGAEGLEGIAGGTTGNNVAFFQVGANANQGITFDFETVSRAITGAASVVTMIGTLISNPGAGSGIGRGISVTPLINEIQASMDDVNSIRANLGALQNRMDFTMRSLDISSENLSNSESRVRDADIAREMMRFTMSNVLQQAAVSMLSQANQLPNNLLQLLR